MRIDDFRFIPVVVIKNIEDTLPCLKALCEGGLPCAEITFRTVCAEDAINLAKKELPCMCIGAGTVINAEQCKRAIGAGAEFIVSPGLSEEVAAICKEKGVPYFPGCVTPTEIMKAISLGLTDIKFFPAGIYGGLKAIKALSAPFPQVRFIPTGGVDMNNIEEFLAFDRIKAVGGSFIMKGDIADNTRKLVEKLK
ncbi:MAG: bifunctional 4-hydroxy-2-oxoglutarate aldolase/2-dehydro-3-deoxy-phosphogluconate aldolase [Clostridia bacterium]|nr:bifunctional 4-hydroxy-2-oxoglutarate aldolase/2-dehydro-3-deoxy-phosphogluconate aldolase [Clostridia bacterium]